MNLKLFQNKPASINGYTLYEAVIATSILILLSTIMINYITGLNSNAKIQKSSEVIPLLKAEAILLNERYELNDTTYTDSTSLITVKRTVANSLDTLVVNLEFSDREGNKIQESRLIR